MTLPMKTLISMLSGACALLLFTGCVATTAGPDNRTSQVRCVYARQQSLPAKGEAKTFAFDTDSTRKSSAEYAAYCKQVTDTLTAYGWREIPGEGKAPLEKPDYWVTVVYGYALDSTAAVGEFRRIAAPALLANNYSASETYGRVAAYYAGLNITSEPLGQGANLFLAQIFGSSEAEITLVLPTLFKHLLKDFPGENITDGNVDLQTRR